MAYQMGRVQTLDEIGRRLGFRDAAGLSDAIGLSGDVTTLVTQVERSYHEAHRRVQPEDVMTFDEYARVCIVDALRARGYHIPTSP